MEKGKEAWRGLREAEKHISDVCACCWGLRSGSSDLPRDPIIDQWGFQEECLAARSDAF